MGGILVSESTYNTIKFHDVLFTAIKATNGNTSQMANLFSSEEDNNVTIDEFGHDIGEPQKYFKYNSGLNVYFANEDQDSNLKVIAVEANSISINGVVLEIGDQISNLTNVNYTIATGLRNTKFINIIKTGHYAESLIIELNSSNIVTKIEYYINP